MSERFFRLVVGGLLLVTLYFEAFQAMPLLLALLVFEGVTDRRLPLLVCRPRASAGPQFTDSTDMVLEQTKARFQVDAERVWRLVVAALLALSYYVFNEALWFFPWFMGFAIFGAGLSGVCPVLISLKLIGFR